MAESLFSSSWYRVAGLKPRLRAHARIHRHQYRGQAWYILQDQSSERYHRFSPAAYYIVGLMDGERSVDAIWHQALAKLGDDAITQDEVIQLLGQLHAADVMQCDVPPDTAELLRRRQKEERQQVRKRVASLFAWQIPLFDPERILASLVPIVRPAYTWVGFLVWLAVVGFGTFLAVTNWQELTRNSLDLLITPENLFALWLIFPLVKMIHEFGHAFAVKSFGGEVHEMGVMVLVFTPVPYVDASGSWAFRSKWQRFVVGGAGMMVELVLATIALVIWLAAEPGTAVRAITYNVMLVAGVSTVLFNANPLLKFDGYYMLMDLIEIPNLRQRANQYFIYLAERYLFGRREAEPPVSTRGERAWFVSFTVLAFLYRILVIVGILLFLGEFSLLLGAVFAIATAVAWFVVPGVKIVNYLANSPRIRRVRGRAVVASLGVTAGVLALFFAVPLPLRTTAEGVVWVPEEGLVRAGTDCFVEKIVARPGSWVKPGDVLLQCTDVDLATEVAVLEGRARELEARYRLAYQDEPVKAQIVDEERRYVAQSLERGRERLAELAIRAKATGQFVVPTPQDLPGRYVRQGELLAHVVNLDTTVVRTIVGQKDIDLVRNATREVDVRLAERIGQVSTGSLARVVPSATAELPSPVLGSEGGGKAVLDPSDPKGQKTVEKYFQIDVDLPTPERLLNVGGRAFVRFDHGWEPVGWQWYRRIRQLFLARFNV